jgi:hypothetical protein
LLLKGVSADADPHYQKLYGRVTDVCSNRRGQPSPSAMKEPRPGRNPSLIRFASPSGKYALLGPIDKTALFEVLQHLWPQNNMRALSGVIHESDIGVGPEVGEARAGVPKWPK